jgi:hypothetical protein
MLHVKLHVKLQRNIQHGSQQLYKQASPWRHHQTHHLLSKALSFSHYLLLAACCLQLSAANRRGVRTDELSASELVVTSAFSKMVASTITYPHEVVRSYMHVTGAQGAGGLCVRSGCMRGGRACLWVKEWVIE